MSVDRQNPGLEGTWTDAGHSKEELCFAKEHAKLRQHFEINDFTHLLNLSRIDPTHVAECLAVWGVLRDDGRRVGTLVLLKDERIVFVVGGCGGSGWGENDESTATYFTTKPSIESLLIDHDAVWQREPPRHLREWIGAGSKDPYPFL